jgi:hypothetical protein
MKPEKLPVLLSIEMKPEFRGENEQPKPGSNDSEMTVHVTPPSEKASTLCPKLMDGRSAS